MPLNRRYFLYPVSLQNRDTAINILKDKGFDVSWVIFPWERDNIGILHFDMETRSAVIFGTMRENTFNRIDFDEFIEIMAIDEEKNKRKYDLQGI